MHSACLGLGIKLASIYKACHVTYQLEISSMALWLGVARSSTWLVYTESVYEYAEVRWLLRLRHDVDATNRGLDRYLTLMMDGIASCRRNNV